MCTGALRVRYTACSIVWIHLTAQDRSIRSLFWHLLDWGEQRARQQAEAQGLREADSSLQKSLPSKAPVLWAGRGGCKLRRGH
uniref:Uncharacterized protein n=2 Tax=Pan TaxID=9596 RepID=A0A2I3S8F7_PANTR